MRKINNPLGKGKETCGGLSWGVGGYGVIPGGASKGSVTKTDVSLYSLTILGTKDNLRSRNSQVVREREGNAPDTFKGETWRLPGAEKSDISALIISLPATVRSPLDIVSFLSHYSPKRKTDASFPLHLFLRFNTLSLCRMDTLGGGSE